MTARYVPGDCAAYVGPRVLVITAGSHRSQVVQIAGLAAPTVLDVIGALAADDLGSLPDLACVVSDGSGTRAVVRGAFRVARGDWSVSGAGVTTWADHPVGGDPAEPVVVSRDGAADPAGDGDTATLPVTDGVVLAACVRWSPTAGDRVRPTAAGPDQPPVSDFQIGPPPPAPTPARATPWPSTTPDPDPTPVRGLPFPPVVGDHDGRTVTVAQLRQQVGAPLPPPPPGVVVPRPRVVLQVPGRPDVVVDRTVLVGRSPRARQSSSAELPTLVVIDDLYVSGTHLELTLDGPTPMAIDHSRNGTLLVQADGPPRPLVRGVPTPLVDGARLTLSDDVALRVSIGGPS